MKTPTTNKAAKARKAAEAEELASRNLDMSMTGPQNPPEAILAVEAAVAANRKAMGLPEPQDIRTPADLKDPEITKEYPEVKVISGLLNTTELHLEMIARWRLACACAVEMLMPDANKREQCEMIYKAADAASKLLDEKRREAQQLSPASVTYRAKAQEDARTAWKSSISADATYEIQEFSKRQNENAARHNRDQLALQIYIAYRGSSEPHTYLIDTESAYEAADAFIAECLKQNER